MMDSWAAVLLESQLFQTRLVIYFGLWIALMTAGRLGIFLFLRYREKRRAGRATGWVTGFAPRGEDGDYFAPVFTFEAAGRQWSYACPEGTYRSRYRLGDEAEIRYCPARPGWASTAEAMAGDWRRFKSTTLWLCLLCPVAVLAVLWRYELGFYVSLLGLTAIYAVSQVRSLRYR